MSFLQEVEFFDPARIDIIESAINRAWEVVSPGEVKDSDKEARNLLALCVMQQLRIGEKNFIRIVNKSIMHFRRRLTLRQENSQQSISQAR